ncbi:hypothetical protein LPJ78_001307 [Coemansia sp. RSA 989]|nr:hypothetical protein BX667DRAFT_238117 [Coemansia mojavensis]KAJ1744030.1 hypothetical protein LPJ68_000414 [Coemansia sp. RSA 1086]KAJ1753502.1 hypothetical protein LPJ79_000361 [Coemansia sp. RSA 1821]KAJ1867094.1 hypothetical protein LPJ78_001307 [Coemansia sp. RSA 989]KAJ1875263.1 hypothetical protein LPJ55_000792 [Coemansia sp. RSA 990]KAJ2676654.1 hypothetical protein IWW42_000529 [Coemansia sp. RSA 1085]
MDKVDSPQAVSAGALNEPIIGASDLERIVIITGPQSALPKDCQQHSINTGLAYRPVVDAHEGVERLYAKFNLPLFEILSETKAKPEEDEQQNDNGPAGAVLKRRRDKQRQSIRSANTEKSANLSKTALEDISDEHYQRLHRKPEYIEKRIRNREIELYQYARWQEGQRKASERSRQQLVRYNQGFMHHTGSDHAVLTGSDGAQASSRCASPMHGNSTDGNKSAAHAEPDSGSANGRTRKRAKPAIGMRKDIAVPQAKYSPRTRAASPAPSNGSNSQSSVSGESHMEHAAEPLSSNAEKLPELGIEQQLRLTDAERKTAHLAGNILEQFWVQALRLPMQSMPASPALLSRSPTPEEPNSAESDNDSEDRSEDTEMSEQSETESVEPRAECNGCYGCCPREFSLPPRITAHILKQRKMQSEKERKSRLKAKK